jgi:hypothetical protein
VNPPPLSSAWSAPLEPSFIEDFIEFYLLPDHPQKTIQLTQLKIKRKSASIPDELMKSVSSIARTLHELHRLKKLGHRLQTSPDSTPLKKLYHEITHLAPSDCLILLSRERYQINDSLLSLVLKTSEDHIDFRRTQLLQHLREEGLPVQNLSDLDPKEALKIRRAADQPALPTPSFNTRLKKLPFSVRFALETGAVLFILIFLMWIIPEIRNKYENSIQKRINDYLIEASLVDSPPPAGTTKEPKMITMPTAEGEKNQVASSSDAAGEASDEGVNSANKKQPKVNEQETWRFSFTGSLTADIEAGIETVLKKYSVDQNKPVTVPGGIQFDFVLPTDHLIALKTSLEEMANELQKKSLSTSNNTDAASARQASLSAINMSWYKKRNMGTRKIPGGHVQVIVWISTL